MKKIIGIITVILLLLGATKGYAYATRCKHAKRLKIGVAGFDFPQGLNFSSLVNDIELTVHLSVSNFSPSTFSIDQVGIDVYTLSGQLIAEQKAPLPKPFIIAPNKDNEYPVSFTIDPRSMGALVRESGGIARIAANKIMEGKYGLNLHLKGFADAEGFTISINEKIEV